MQIRSTTTWPDYCLFHLIHSSSSSHKVQKHTHRQRPNASRAKSWKLMDLLARILQTERFVVHSTIAIIYPCSLVFRDSTHPGQEDSQVHLYARGRGPPYYSSVFVREGSNLHRTNVKLLSARLAQSAAVHKRLQLLYAEPPPGPHHSTGRIIFRWLTELYEPLIAYCAINVPCK